MKNQGNDYAKLMNKLTAKLISGQWSQCVGDRMLDRAAGDLQSCRLEGQSTCPLCLRGSLAQCTLSLRQLSAGSGFNTQTRQNKLFQDYWRSCFEINFSDRQEGFTVSSIICDR